MIKFLKSLAVIMTAVFTMMSLPASAVKNIVFVDNSNGTATVTADDVNKFAVAQYNDLGFLVDFGISGLVGGKQTVNMDYDSDLKTKLISFADWENLSPDGEAYRIGNNTLFYADFEDGYQGSYTVYELGYEINKKYATTDRNGNATNALLMKGTTVDTPFNIQFGGADGGESDVVVFEYDLRLNDVDTTFISYIKALKQDGSAGGWQTLWKVTPDDEDSAKISFGETAFSTKSLMADKWYRLSVAVDYNQSIIKYYMDMTLIGEETIVSTIHPDVNSPDIFYIHGQKEGRTDFMVDNVRVYEGTHPRDTIEEYVYHFNTVRPSIVEPKETSAREILAGKLVVHTRNGVATNRAGKKTLMVNAPYNENGTHYVHLAEICKAWGITAPANLTVTDKGYVELPSLAEALGLNLYMPEVIKNSGMAILAEEFTAPADSELQSLNNYAFFRRATDDDVTKAYKNSKTKGVHPRVLATQSDFDRIRNMYEAGTDEAFMRWANQVIEFADDRIDKAPPAYSEMSSSGRTLQRKLKSDIYAWAMAYHLTGDEKYVRKTFDELNYFCEFPTWYPQDHLHIIETMDAFAIGYDWLYNKFTVDERRILEENMYEKGFIPSYEAFRSTASAMSNAFYAANNHGTICNGGITMTALAFMDVYPEECAWFVENAMKGMEYNLDKWYTGAWYEGPHYWEYTIMYTSKFIESMQSVLGTDFGFGKLQGLDLAAEKEINMQGCLGIYNYADAGMGEYYVPEMLWLAGEYNNPAVATKVVKEYDGTFPKGNRQPGESLTLAVLWYNPGMIEESAIFPKDCFFEELDVITMREGWEKTDTFAGVKAGVLNEAHSHLDAGSFIFESDGIRWLQELGADSYKDGYFESGTGGRRWRSIQARAEGHSTVSVNPGNIEDMNVANNGATAHMTLVDVDERGLIATVDMTEVLFDVSEATRGFFFTDNRQSLVVRDEITLIKLPVEENFDGKTSTKIFGTYDVNYELVSGKAYGLQESDTVARLTGENRYFNNVPWNRNSGTQQLTFEFDLYTEDANTTFQFYPVGSNRYGIQVNGGMVYSLIPGWKTVSTNKSMPAKEWHHFKIEYEMANGQMLIYMDNSLIYTQTGLDKTAYTPMDHYFNLAKLVDDKGVAVNNVKCYTKESVENNDVVYWRLITDPYATVTVDGDNNIITMAKDGKSCIIEYQVEGGTIAEEKFEKPIVSIISNAKPIADRYGRVVLKITNTSSDVKITAKITPGNAENTTPLSFYTKAISSWTLN